MGRELEATGWGIHTGDFYSWRACDGEYKKIRNRNCHPKLLPEENSKEKEKQMEVSGGP